MSRQPTAPASSHAGLRFPREARVRQGADFQLCFAARQRLPGRFFVLHWRHNAAVGPRLGLAVSRKVDRRAVGRNRLKRLLREAFRSERARLPAMDLVIIAKPEASKVDGEALRDDLTRLWKRLCALPAPPPQGTMPAASEPPGASDVTSGVAPPTC